MAATAMFGLYTLNNNYGLTDHISVDEDQSVALSSYRRIDPNSKNKHMNHVASERDLKESIGPEPGTMVMNTVEVDNACYVYGKGAQAVHALRKITLVVPQGKIYGLLGPSGCGKTTLLRCIVGRLQAQQGSVKVLGSAPGSAGSQVPGPAVGYMPQELALFPDFTIEETLRFFGRLYRMKDSDMKARVKFLVDFLELPKKSRLVGTLSGGQKRRVSLAVALIHSPPLLILDEPTVGVDPVLRQLIWNYLVTLTRNSPLTVIITTHYIEEARAADVVGLMRFGRLLVEASPQSLLRSFGLSTLEDVFLKLCQLDSLNDGRTEKDIDANETQFTTELTINKPDICNSGDVQQMYNGQVAGRQTPRLSNGNASNESNGDLNVSALGNDSLEGNTMKSFGLRKTSAIADSLFRTSALFKKNLTRLHRNLPILLFQFLLPSIEIILFCVCIGRDPFNIPVAVYNQESPATFSNVFLQNLDNTTIRQVNHNTLESALLSVKTGHAWAAISIGQNFSSALKLRVLMGAEVDNATIKESRVHLHLDMTNQVIGYKIQRTVFESFDQFSRKMLNRFELNPLAMDIPLKMETPIYGSKDPSFTEFMAPGVLLSIAFLAAVALTALAFVMERKEGLLERSLVAGVTSYEFLLSHVLTQLLVLNVQIVLLLIFTFAVFAIPSEGPFIWVILLTLLQGSCGMAYGLMISALCKEENTATMLALGSFYPNLLLSGTVWPTQAMPDLMRYFSYILPQTLPIESLRYIVSRGWDPSYPEVGIGFAITIGWTMVFLIAAVVIFRYKK